MYGKDTSVRRTTSLIKGAGLLTGLTSNSVNRKLPLQKLFKVLFLNSFSLQLKHKSKYR